MATTERMIRIGNLRKKDELKYFFLVSSDLTPSRTMTELTPKSERMVKIADKERAREKAPKALAPRILAEYIRTKALKVLPIKVPEKSQAADLTIFSVIFQIVVDVKDGTCGVSGSNIVLIV